VVKENSDNAVKKKYKLLHYVYENELLHYVYENELLHYVSENELIIHHILLGKCAKEFNFRDPHD
jgi:hypothetical protein